MNTQKSLSDLAMQEGASNYQLDADHLKCCAFDVPPRYALQRPVSWYVMYFIKTPNDIAP